MNKNRLVHNTNANQNSKGEIKVEQVYDTSYNISSHQHMANAHALFY